MSEDVQHVVAQFAREQEQRKLVLLEQMKRIEQETEAQVRKIVSQTLESTSKDASVANQLLALKGQQSKEDPTFDLTLPENIEAVDRALGASMPSPMSANWSLGNLSGIPSQIGDTPLPKGGDPQFQTPISRFQGSLPLDQHSHIKNQKEFKKMMDLRPLEEEAHDGDSGSKSPPPKKEASKKRKLTKAEKAKSKVVDRDLEEGDFEDEEEPDVPPPKK
jgi:hypothetical protein